jgi:ribonucleoside-diphosphate reductase alpha chain
MKIINMSRAGDRPMYQPEDVFNESLQYFNGDELATNVFIDKYILRDNDGNIMERTPDDMHRRLASEFARVEKKFGGDRALSEEEIYEQFKNFKYIVPQGSPMYGVGNNYKAISLSNCVVVKSPDDTMSSIMDTGKDLANLYKRRCGVGLDISTLRPDGATVSNSAGTSSGAWSFADLYSLVTRMVGQAGRRGALMITMDVRHPDIEKFITMKRDLTKVTGANISIKLIDVFLNAVSEDEDFVLRFPVDSDKPTHTRTVKAKELWDLIVDCATETAEPGILMWDNITNYMPAESYADVGFKTVSTNPCSEIPLSAYDSCRLISINLKHFISDRFTDNAKFNFKLLKEVAHKAMRLSDDLVELEIEKLAKIKTVCDDKSEKDLWNKLLKACKDGRRTGLGTHGLADALANMCIPYDSDEALVLVDKIYKTIKESAYEESVELAKERGAFSVFNWDKEKDNKYIKSLPKRIRDSIEEFGRRNISILTNAPTGSVSLVSQTSSGLEPVYKNTHIRRKKINRDSGNTHVDFVDNMGDKWQEFEIFHHNVSDWLKRNMDTSEKLNIPDFFTESDNIDWMKRVEIQGIIQSHLDHAISSTINLPSDTKPELVGKIYMEGWRKGLKGITVYRDGARSGVLVSEKDKDSVETKDAPKRPDMLECDIHSASVKGEKWIILVGLMDGKPYEVFGGLSENVEIPAKYKKGTIIKASSNKTTANRYDLKLNGLKINNITKMFDNPLYQVHTRMVSLGLRHGVKPSFLVEQLQKDPDNDLTSFSKVLARVLKKYIEDGTKVTSDKVCPTCGSEALVYQEGCVTCKNCGFAKCG